MDRVTLCLGFPGTLLIYVSQVISNGTLFTLKNALVWKIRYVITVFENLFNFINIPLSPLGGIPWWSNG